MTHDLLQYLASVIKTNLSFLDEVQYLGRKSVDGYTLADNNYVGITDKRGQYGYFRIQGEQDHTYTRTENAVTSRGSWYNVKAPLRLVLVVDLRDCGGVHSLESNLVKILNSATFPPSNFGRVTLNVQSSSTDFERIFQEETDQEDIVWNDSYALVSIDFELVYLSNECCQISQPSNGGSCDPGLVTRENPDNGLQEEYFTVPSGSTQELEAPGVHANTEANPEAGAYTIGWPIVLAFDTPGDDLIIQNVDRDGGFTLVEVERPACNDDPVEIFFDERDGSPASQGTVSPGATYIVLDQKITDILGTTQEVAYQGEEIRIEHDAGDISFDTSTPGLVKISVGSAPSGILYFPTAPSLVNERHILVGDTVWQAQNGRFDYTPPENPVSVAEIDYLATQADIRVTPAAGTFSFSKLGETRLKENNRYGNKYRFTDDAGNPSSASAATNIWAHVNWRQHNWAGATPYYVRDHLTGFAYVVRGIVSSGKYNIDNLGNGATWESWINHITVNFSIGSYTDKDFFAPFHGVGGAYIAFFASHTWARNFFFDQAFASRCYGLSGDTPNNTPANFFGFHDSDNDNYIAFQISKALGSGFSNRITAIHPMRIDRS